MSVKRLFEYSNMRTNTMIKTFCFGFKLLMIVLLGLFLSVTEGYADAIEDPFKQLKEGVRDRFPEVEQLSTKEFSQQFLNRGSREGERQYVLLDVREPEEYAVGRIPGATLAKNLDWALEALSGVPKSTQVIVYCSVGYRSSKLARALSKQGYNHIQNLEGSLFEWASLGLPMENDFGATTKVHPYDWWRMWYLDERLRAWKPEPSIAK